MRHRRRPEKHLLLLLLVQPYGVTRAQLTRLASRSVPRQSEGADLSENFREDYNFKVDFF